ncbi:MAG: hypothetical protein ACR2QE_10180 [Acidimicrobiales bacterium]
MITTWRTRMLAVGLGAVVATLVPFAPVGAANHTCGGQPATLVGTAGNDVIVGTARTDVIVTLGGDDTVSGLAGDDLICVGGGDDRVNAGAGADRVWGGPGDDVLITGIGDDRAFGQDGDDQLSTKAGDDVLRGGAGNDRLIAGDGDDRIFGHVGNDLLRGGAGDDTAAGGADRDLLIGSRGDDILGAGSGADRIKGGADNDVLRGGNGTDTLLGGDHNDVLVGGSGVDQLDGGRGTDRCAPGGGRDANICENSAPPPGTFGCLPDGYTSVIQQGVVGSAANPMSGPRGPVVLVGDSLTSGSPVGLAELLTDLGFGPVCVDGVGSRRLGAAPGDHPGGFAAIERIRAVHPVWSSDATWIIALGTNDARFWPDLTVDVAAAEVDATFDGLGPAARDRWWINVRTTQNWAQERETAWNAGIEAQAGFGIIDWSSVAPDRPDLFFDDVHPNSDGNIERLALIAETLG